jgi:hypothetical protein
MSPLHVHDVQYHDPLETRHDEPWRSGYDPLRPLCLRCGFGCTLVMADGARIRVPIQDGFSTDLASYRWWMLPGLMIPRKAEVAHPSVLHDYLIRTRELEHRLKVDAWTADRLADEAYRVGQWWIAPRKQRRGYWGVRIGSWLRAVDRRLGTYIVRTRPRTVSEVKASNT